MKVLAFAGSSSRNSINKKLALYAAGLIKDAKVEVLDLNDYEMPLFSVDKEAETGKQENAILFLDKIKDTDFIVISLAEHNGSYSAAFKNIFDWSSRINGKVFQNKPMLLMAASDGARGGASVLGAATARFPKMGANIKATFSFPEFEKNFDREKGIVNDELRNKLETIIEGISIK